MKAVHLVTGSLAAGLAAAFVGGAFWAQDTDVDSARYLLSGDAITVAGAVLGALFAVLAARLLYAGVRTGRDRRGGAAHTSSARTSAPVPPA